MDELNHRLQLEESQGVLYDKVTMKYRACLEFGFIILGMGYGNVTLMQIGGAIDRFEYCISGKPLEQIAVAEPIAKSGETCASPQSRT